MRIMNISLMNNAAKSSNYSFSFASGISFIAGGLKMKSPLLADTVSFEGTGKPKKNAGSKKGTGPKKSKGKGKSHGKKKKEKPVEQMTTEEKNAKMREILERARKRIEKEGRPNLDDMPSDAKPQETNMEKAMRLYGERNY